MKDLPATCDETATCLSHLPATWSASSQVSWLHRFPQQMVTRCFCDITHPHEWTLVLSMLKLCPLNIYLFWSFQLHHTVNKFHPMDLASQQTFGLVIARKAQVFPVRHASEAAKWNSFYYHTRTFPARQPRRPSDTVKSSRSRISLALWLLFPRPFVLLDHGLKCLKGALCK